ncbi:putative UPF0481 protein At3g02645 [Arachis stenosperma]|uniref:putative UPF0481 protein At3g02645 n=1 Tax=Arachis stenosperma TaxID=217475 RepID=UPI0025AD26DB|nr:putative UPF0481 protein At3g02645 [Arachis stenosperma]
MDDTNDDNRPTIDNEASKLIAQKESTSHAIESEAANKLNEWKDSTTDAIESEATKLIAVRESTTKLIALKESTTDEIKSKTTNKLIQLKESATDAIESDETTRLIPSKESSINDTIENNADTKLNEWRETTKSLLGRFRSQSEPFNISNIPAQLREGNKNAYMPKAISIGPRYKGTRTNLVQWEKIKWQCMQSLLHRGPKGPETNLKECMGVVMGLEKEVRANYADDLKLEWNDLANIMLSDACFLLELLICASNELNQKLKSRLEPSGPGGDVGKKEEVLVDLLKLQNQMPLFILHKLSDQIFYEVVPVETLALNLFGYFPETSFKCFTPDIPSQHFLELVNAYISDDGEEGALITEQRQESQHMCIPINVVRNFREVGTQCSNCCAPIFGQAVTSVDDEFAQNVGEFRQNQYVSNAMDISNSQFVSDAMENGKNNDATSQTYRAEHNRCARILEAAGVTIKARITKKEAQNTDNQGQPVVTTRGFDFDIRFIKGNGTLEIPQLHITNSTEVTWQNLIAWEQGHTGFSCKHRCTWAAFFFNGLICRESDIQLLKDRKVIVDHMNMTNKKLLEYFRSLVIGVDRVKINDSPYWQMVRILNKYSGTKCHVIKRSSILLWHSWLPGAVRRIDRFFLRSYSCLIGMISVYTLLSAVFQILDYYNRKTDRLGPAASPRALLRG